MSLWNKSKPTKYDGLIFASVKILDEESEWITSEHIVCTVGDHGRLHLENDNEPYWKADVSNVTKWCDYATINYLLNVLPGREFEINYIFKLERPAENIVFDFNLKREDK